MKTLMTFAAVALCASALTLGAGCGKKDKDDKKSNSSKKATGGDKGKAKAGGSIIGKWQFTGQKIFQTFNSKGRVKYDLPGGAKCLGSYTVKEGRLDLKYDKGQSNCMDGGMGFQLKDGGKVLDFGAAKYNRIDSKDDTSF